MAVVIFREKAMKCFFKPSYIPPFLCSSALTESLEQVRIDVD